MEYAIRFASDSDLEKISELANRTLDPKDPDFNNQYHELNLTFHLSIARLTRNTYLISALENVFNRLRRDLLIDGRSNLENSSGYAHTAGCGYETQRSGAGSPDYS